MKMFQGMYNTFVVDTGCNEIGVPLHFFGSISHSHPYSGIFPVSYTHLTLPTILRV